MKLFALFSLACLCFAADITTSVRAPNDNTTTATIFYRPAPLNASGTWTYFPPLNRRLTYFILAGKAIIDMDQVYGSALDLLNSRVSQRRSVPPQLGRRALSFRTDDSRRWSGGVVQYYWFDAASKALREKQFLEAVGIWQTMLPWLRFAEQGISQITWGNGPLVIQGVQGNNSASTVGHNPLPDGNFLLLGDASSPRIYVHQIGHVLGLLHEHQRPDRASVFDLFCDRLLCQPQFSGTTQTGCISPSCDPDTCTGYGCDFVPYAADFPGLNASGAYDTSSIMQIDPSSLRSPLAAGNPLVPVAGHTYVPPTSCFPSIGDARRVCALYAEACTGICGDGVQDAGEECDDGNNVAGDGCSADCKTEGGGTPEVPPGGNGTCFETCDPHPPNDHCDITTSCIYMEGAQPAHEYNCACRDGFKTETNSTNVQYRLPYPGQETRVFVKPGEVCDTLCTELGCAEVPMQSQCF